MAPFLAFCRDGHQFDWRYDSHCGIEHFIMSRKVVYIINFLDVLVPLPCDLLPGIVLRRASAKEIELISNFNRYTRGSSNGLEYHRYRVTFGKEGGASASLLSNPDLWRYYVLDYEGTEKPSGELGPRRLEVLERACLVAEASMKWAVSSDAEPSRLGPPNWYHPTKNFVLRELWDVDVSGDVPQFTEGDVTEIQNLFSRLTALEEGQKVIPEAIEAFSNVHMIPHGSDFHLLALFSTIEFLVTHKPTGSELGDGLTRQIKTKLPLLSKRFRQKVDHSAYFAAMPEDKCWEILYSYRSAIAHGASRDFKSAYKQGGFSELKSRRAVLRFLRLFTRRLLGHAVIEPTLVLDLKKC
jgi:hypothetical protein